MTQTSLVRRLNLEEDLLVVGVAGTVEATRQAAAKYEPDMEVKGKYLLDIIRKRSADGVIFSAASFCDPALLDQPMMITRVEAEGIPYITMQYAENSGQMQPIREQSGTFADSIKLWSGV